MSLQDLDREDLRCQFRLSTDVSDLRRSLLAEGQQVPVILYGSKPPYVIVDGFRRIEAIADIGWPHVLAIVRADIDHAQAFALGFIENVKRKNFSSWDKANAVWQAIHQRGMKKDDVVTALEISPRQVERYLSLMAFDGELRAAVQAGRLSMAHAVVLHRAGAGGIKEWVRECAAAGLSAKQLKQRLTRLGKRGRPRVYIRSSGGGFRLYAMKFDPARVQNEAQVAKMLAALESAVQCLKAATRRGPGG